MWIRAQTVRNKDGNTRTYLHLVQSRRVNDKVRQEIISTLGAARCASGQWCFRSVDSLAGPSLRAAMGRVWGFTSGGAMELRVWHSAGVVEVVGEAGATSSRGPQASTQASISLYFILTKEIGCSGTSPPPALRQLWGVSNLGYAGSRHMAGTAIGGFSKLLI